MVRCPSWFAILMLVGCGDSSASDATGAGGSTGGSGGSGGQVVVGGGASGGIGGAGGAGGAGCDVNEVPLTVDFTDLLPTRLHMATKYEGEDAALLIDTGSALNFIFLGDEGRRYIPNFADVPVGCSEVGFDARAINATPDSAGLPTVGILGAEFFLESTTVVDTDRGLLTRYQGAAAPAMADWLSLAFEDVQGHVIPTVSLDGTPVRMMFDTGSPHILWLGEEGQPGDLEVTTTDALGNVLTLYLGEVELTLGDEPPTLVPVLRAPSFPSFEQTVEALGGDIHGLVGLSALSGRSFAIDAPNIRMAPAP